MPVHRSRRRLERAVGSVLAATLAAGVAGAVQLQPGPAPAAARTTHARTPATLSRTEAVTALLAARASAVLHRDRAAFLATVDPEAGAFRQRQAALVDDLRAVPLSSWRYELDPSRERPRPAALDAVRGTWWAPEVTLRYALAGYDPAPAVQPQALTFVERAGRWYVGADDDVAASGHRTGRDLWDDGPVVVAQGRSCLVLGHPRSARLVRQLVGDCDAAVPRVTAVWGTGWARRVVLLVPDSAAELARLVPDAGDLSQIAAVATAELEQPTSGYHPVGDRVLVNPANFADLGPVGRRVVLTHEVTHVATRGATGPQVPTWLVEGLADYVGYQGVTLPLAVSAQELRADVRRGRLPRALPADAAFDGSRPDLAQSYEQSWLAVGLLARTYGRPALLRLYRDTGADPQAGALGRALVRDLHTTLAAFTASWRADLRRRLS